MLPRLREVTVLRDTAEKRPLPFPSHLVVHDPRPRTLRIHLASQSLDTGDYALLGYPEAGVVERKGALREIAQNTQSFDLARHSRVVARLHALPRAALLLEGPIQSLLPTSICPAPGAAISTLLSMTPRLSLLVLPCTTALQRLACGEWVLRWLLAGVGYTPPSRDQDDSLLPRAAVASQGTEVAENG